MRTHGSGLPIRGSLVGLMLAVTLGFACDRIEAQQSRAMTTIFADASLDSAIQVMANLTNRRFIIDPRVVGSITLMQAALSDPEQLLKEFQAKLLEQGFATRVIGNDIKIEPMSAKTASDAPDRVISSEPPFLATTDLSGRKVSTLQQRPMRPDFTKEIRLEPVVDNGVQRGYRVYPRSAEREFARLGLDPGDLVLSINGHALDDPQSGVQIFNESIAAAVIGVRIERAGRVQSLLLANHYSQ